jgi:hypothetical protein
LETRGRIQTSRNRSLVPPSDGLGYTRASRLRCQGISNCWEARGAGTNAVDGSADVILPVTRCDKPDGTPRATMKVDRMNEKTKCRRGGRINRYPFLVILFLSIETIPMAHALSADRSAVSKSIATSFIAMAWLKIQFFTRHRENGNSAAASASAHRENILPEHRP